MALAGGGGAAGREASGCGVGVGSGVATAEGTAAPGDSGAGAARRGRLVRSRIDPEAGPSAVTSVVAVVDRWGPGAPGVDPLWTDISHSPFLNQPALCAEVILEATQRAPIGRFVPTELTVSIQIFDAYRSWH